MEKTERNVTEVPARTNDTRMHEDDAVVVTAESDNVERRPKIGAKFKIDLIYDDRFSASKRNLGIVSIWGSGGEAMPMADWKIYECPRDSCLGLITPATHADTITACPMCKTAWNPKQLVGERLFVVTVDRWADIIAKYLTRLEMDADIYLKRLKSKLSIMEANEKEALGQYGGEILEEARQLEAVMYSKDRLIKDTVENKRSIESAIRAFLLA